MALVSITTYMEQVSHGSHYRGYVEIASAKFDYELVFSIPISELDNLETPKEDSAIRQIFQITVKRYNVDVELTNDEYEFFFSIITALAINFYQTPQIFNSKKSFLNSLLDSLAVIIRGKEPVADFDVSTFIGVKKSVIFELSPAFCEVLNAPKFGCALIV